MPSILAVCVVHALRPDPGPVGVTAIDKRAVTGPVRVGRYGLRADVQADRKYHGGEDQAVYVYGQDDADHWARELGRDLPPGWFGENLRVTGLDPNAARVGERWRVGADVVLEVTGPRTPCATFARWVGGDDERGWVRRFRDAGRVGAYLRVVQRGSVQVGDEVVVERAAPPDAPTVHEVLLGGR
ncbi:MOSC domain-containing protein [Cellulomonas xiejunii]|uniref:MOSC domain-containing protein n=1 Tax=Cellulomonas xiejunii TaxID=2968083 RepID=UPI001D0E482E|nr:MOSC domain-containing protein [Cellulomonas xiejunii]MCC2315549.1 MOSC domain-containing protein [Cellulomonas xiejunii]